jgi:hypothetical protein
MSNGHNRDPMRPQHIEQAHERFQEINDQIGLRVSDSSPDDRQAFAETPQAQDSVPEGGQRLHASCTLKGKPRAFDGSKTIPKRFRKELRQRAIRIPADCHRHDFVTLWFEGLRYGDRLVIWPRPSPSAL